MKFSFWQSYSDITALSLPTFEIVEAESREQAVAQFAKAYNFTVDEYDRYSAWFTASDGKNFEYSVTLRED